MKRTFVASLVLCSILAAAPALAAGVDPANATPVQREQAQTHFLKGKASFDKNDMPGALEEFRASLEIVASPNARLYVARTLREMGHLVEAYVEYGRTAAEAKEHEREDGRYAKAAEAALAERATIAAQLGFVQLNIKNTTDATTVTVASSPLVKGGWSDPVPVKPGDVEVEVVTPGVLPIRKTLKLAAGQKTPLDIDAGVGGTGDPSNPGTPLTPVAEHPTNSHAGKGWMLPVAIAGGGVGVVGFAIFIGAGVASQSTYNDLKKQCGTAPCPSSLAGEVSSGKTQQAVANTGLVIGLLGVAVGATFLTLWLLPSKSPAQQASASLVIGPGSLGVAGTF